jgi:hypothetical protein
MKDRTARIETDRNVLERIAAILLALAVLAERAAGASYPVRCFVLCILRRADDVARAFITGFACDAVGGQESPILAPVRRGFDPADAAVLAASLRMLAFLLLNMAAQASKGTSGGTCGDSLLFSARASLEAAAHFGGKKVNCPLRLARAPPRRRHAGAHTASPSFKSSMARAERQRGNDGDRPRAASVLRVFRMDRRAPWQVSAI